MTEKTIHINGKPTKTTRKTIDHASAVRLAEGDGKPINPKDKYSVICYDPATGCGEALGPDSPKRNLEDDTVLTVSKRPW